MSRKRTLLMSAVQFDQELKDRTISMTALPAMAAALGLAGVEFRDIYWQDKTEELPCIASEMARLGMLSTYATFTPLFNQEEEKRRKLLADLDDAHALGAPFLRVFRGQPPASTDASDPVMAGARQAIARAEQFGMKLALENHVGKFGPTITDVAEAVTMLDSPTVGVNFDPANYVFNQQDPMEALRLLGDKVIYSHLKDVRQTAEGPLQTYLGNGEMELRLWQAELDKVQPDIPLCFEFGGGGEAIVRLQRSLEVMNSL